VFDSAAILTYLALKFRPSWYPVSEPVKVARINAWMSFSANEIHNSLLKVRVSKKFGWYLYFNTLECMFLLGSVRDITPLSYSQAIAASHKVLSYLESHLAIGEKTGRHWLVDGDAPSIADIAVFPYVAFAEHSSENEIQLRAYPSVLLWIQRFKKLPGFVGLPGVDDV
jgi:glutathione S-transferase